MAKVKGGECLTSQWPWGEEESEEKTRNRGCLQSYSSSAPDTHTSFLYLLMVLMVLLWYCLWYCSYQCQMYILLLPAWDWLCLRTQCHSPSAIQWRLYLSEVKSDLVRVWGLLVLFICLEPKLLFLYKRRHTGYVSYKMPVRDWKNTTDLSTVVNQFLNAVKA